MRRQVASPMPVPSCVSEPLGPFEGFKDFVAVLTLYAHAVITHLKNIIVLLADYMHRYFRMHIGPPVFNGVTQQILEQLDKLRTVGLDDRQMFHQNDCVIALNGML